MLSRLLLHDDEEWSELRPSVSGLPLRPFDPVEIKRVAMAQLPLRLLPSDTAVLRVEPVLSASLFERFQTSRALEASRAGEGDGEVVDVGDVAESTEVEAAEAEEEEEEEVEAEGAEAEEAVAVAAAADDGSDGCAGGESVVASLAGNERLLAPTLAFHGAPSREALSGILAEGLLAAGEVSSSTGRMLRAQHGNRFGDGRYLSQDIHLAGSYSVADVSCRQQVLLCLVAPGRCERLAPGFEATVAAGDATMRGHDWQIARCRACAAPRCDGVQCELQAARARRDEWRKRQQQTPTAPATKLTVGAATSMVEVERHRAEVAAHDARRAAGLSEVELAEGARLEAAVARLEAEALKAAALGNYHSRISPDQKQLIVADADQVLPLLLVTFERGNAVDLRRTGLLQRDLVRPSIHGARCTMHALDDWAGAVAMAASATEIAAQKARDVTRLLSWNGATDARPTKSAAKAARALLRAAAEEERAAAAEADKVRKEAAAEAVEATDMTAAAGSDACCLLAPIKLPRLQPGETSQILRLRTTRALSAPITITIVTEPADALSASPRSVTINPPESIKPTVEQGKARHEYTPPPPLPHATFKLTATRAVDAPVVVRYELSGAGALDVTPPPPGAVAIRRCTWAVTIPREIVELEMHRGTTSVHLITIIHGAPDAERASSLAAVRHLVRELQPQTTALVESAEAAPARVRMSLGAPDRLLAKLDGLKSAPPPASVDFAMQTAAEKARSNEGLMDGVMVALDLALASLERGREERLLRATARAEREVWTQQLPACGGRGQSIEAWCKCAVNGIAQHAESLGAAGEAKRRRWVEQAATAHAEDLRRREDALFMIQIVQHGRALAPAPHPTATAGGMAFALQTDALSVASRRITGSGLMLAVRVLICGGDADPATALAAKAALQTVSAWEPTPLYLAATRKALPAAVRQLCQDSQRCCFATPLSVAIPAASRELHSGLVTQIGQQPVWTTGVRLVASEGVSLLFQGAPPRTILLNGLELPARLCGPTRRGESALEALCRHAFIDPPLLVHMLRLVQQHVCALRVAAGRRADGRRADVIDAVNWMRLLVRSLSAPPVELHGLSAAATTSDGPLGGALADPAKRCFMLRERRRVASDLMAALKEVEETSLLAAAATGAEGLTAAAFLAKPSELKFGAKVLRRVARSPAPTVSMPALLRWLASRWIESRGEGEQSRAIKPLPSHTELAGRALTMWAELQTFAAATMRRERTAPPGVAALLYSFGMVGLQLRIGRSEAATINPWAIRVEYLSRSSCDTATALSALDCGHRLVDGTGELAPDVLVLLDPALGSEACEPVAHFLHSALYSTHLALTFTRSAALRLPAQRAALLVVSFAKACEQLLRRRGGDRVAEPRVMRQPSRFEIDSSVEDMRIALAILHTLQVTQPHATAVTPELAAQLLGPNPGACMTEAGDGGLDSACQLLVVLCVADELAPLFSPTAEAAAQRSRVAMALLAEAVSRSCRVLLRSSPPASAEDIEARTGQSPMLLTARALVRKALGITPDSCHDVMADELDEPTAIEHRDEYDVDKAVRASGGFFLKAYTNATPFAVVACVGVAEVVHAWLQDEAGGHTLQTVLADAHASSALAAALAAAFESKRISMRRFLEDHLPDASPQHVQAALYCQGLIHHDSRARRAGLPPLSRGHELLQALAADERREVYLARLQQKHARLAAAEATRRRGVRLAVARAAKAEFMATHEGVPQLFDQAEVARLNATRPAHDQLELVGGAPGLLKHHCCYPRCPHFLCDLRSASDRAAATAAGTAARPEHAAAHFRRHGLFRHLRWFQYPDRSWINGLHATALQVYSRQPGLARARFIESCARKLDERRMNGMSRDELERLLGLIHDARIGRG